MSLFNVLPPELDLEILYHLDNQSLYQLCMANTSLSKLCFKDPILKQRIDDYLEDEAKKLKIRNYVNDIVKNKFKQLTFRFDVLNDDLFPPHMIHEIRELIGSNIIKEWSIRVEHVGAIYSIYIRFYKVKGGAISKTFTISINDYIYIMNKLIYYDDRYYNYI